jgi:hypothetical protein
VIRAAARIEPLQGAGLLLGDDGVAVIRKNDHEEPVETRLIQTPSVSGCSGPRAQDPGPENRTADLDLLGFGRRGCDRTASPSGKSARHRFELLHAVRAEPGGSARDLFSLNGEEVFLFRAPIGSDAPLAVIRLSYHVPTSHLSSGPVQTRYLGRPLLTAGRASASE